MTATPADVFVEVTDLQDPNPAGIQITARLTRGNGTRELSIKYGPDDMPDDDEVLAIADRLGEQVWGKDANLHHREGRRDDDRGRRGRRGGYLPGPSNT